MPICTTTLGVCADRPIVIDVCDRHTCDKRPKDLHRGGGEDLDNGLTHTLSGSLSHGCLPGCGLKESAELHDLCNGRQQLVVCIVTTEQVCLEGKDCHCTHPSLCWNACSVVIYSLLYTTYRHLLSLRVAWSAHSKTCTLYSSTAFQQIVKHNCWSIN